MPEELSTTQARTSLPHLVREAQRGHATYITPRGSSVPVAAVVPAHLAQNHTPPAAPSLPTGPSGAHTPDSDADQEWTEAALVALQHQLTQGQTALGQVQEQLNAARILAAQGRVSQARDLIAATPMAQALTRLDGAGVESLALRDAIAAPGPAECKVCGHALERHRGGTGWTHVAQHPDTGRWEPIAASDPHTPVACHLPPTRPDIRGGRVDETLEE